jgi:hypothetical protein
MNPNGGERKGRSCRQPEEKADSGRSKSIGKKWMLPPRVEIDPPRGRVAGIRVAAGQKQNFVYHVRNNMC